MKQELPKEVFASTAASIDQAFVDNDYRGNGEFSVLLRARPPSVRLMGSARGEYGEGPARGLRSWSARQDVAYLQITVIFLLKIFPTNVPSVFLMLSEGLAILLFVRGRPSILGFCSIRCICLEHRLFD